MFEVSYDRVASAVYISALLSNTPVIFSDRLLYEHLNTYWWTRISVINPANSKHGIKSDLNSFGLTSMHSVFLVLYLNIIILSKTVTVQLDCQHGLLIQMLYIDAMLA